jgi:hypothetical protein
MIRPMTWRWTALACNALFAICLVTVHFLDREPDPLVVSVSYYALTPHGWLATIGFLALAAGSALVARIASYSGDRPKSLALMASSVAIVLLSIFPCDPWYPWERTPTPTGAVHALAACAPIALLPLVALRDVLTGRLQRAQPSAVGFTILYLVASVAVGAYITGSLIMGTDPSFAGLGERAVVLAGVLWLSAMAFGRPAYAAQASAPTDRRLENFFARHD